MFIYFPMRNETLCVINIETHHNTNKSTHIAYRCGLNPLGETQLLTWKMKKMENFVSQSGLWQFSLLTIPSPAAHLHLEKIGVILINRVMN